MNFSGLICDLDGTLLDSIADLGESMNTVLAADGLAPPPHFRLPSFGGRRRGDVGRALPAAPAAFAGRWCTEMARRMREVYSGRWGVHTRPYEGIEEMLAQAHQAGCDPGGAFQ